MSKLLLQEYDDNTFGYFSFDGDDKQNLETGAKVIKQQAQDESREDFINKNDIRFKPNQYGSNEQADIIVIKTLFINNYNVYIDDDVKSLIDKGYGIDEFITYGNNSVRQQIAMSGYKLDILINDKNDSVRLKVAEYGYGLDILVNDSCPYVRKAVAEHGYGLDKLVNDPSESVRRVVAEKGYGLDKLINDNYSYVFNGVIIGACETNNLAIIKQLEELSKTRSHRDRYTILTNLIMYNYIQDDRIKELDHICIRYIIKNTKIKGVRDFVYQKICKHEVEYDYDIIVLLKKFDYDLDMFCFDKDVQIRKLLFNEKYIDKYVADRSSEIRGRLANIINNYTNDQLTDFINRNIVSIVKYEKYYRKLIFWAIENNIQTKYLMTHAKTEDVLDKLAGFYEPKEIEVSKLKKYHLNSSMAHCFRNYSNQYKSMSTSAMLRGEIKIIQTGSSSDTRRVAVLGAKTRGDKFAGCQDGYYYKVLDNGKNFGDDGFYIHESFLTGISEVPKGIFEEY